MSGWTNAAFWLVWFVSGCCAVRFMAKDDQGWQFTVSALVALVCLFVGMIFRIAPL